VTGDHDDRLPHAQLVHCGVKRACGSGLSYVPLPKPAPSGFLKVTLVPQQQETVPRVWGSSLPLPPLPLFQAVPEALAWLLRAAWLLCAPARSLPACLPPSCFLTLSDPWKVFSCLCWSPGRPGLLCPSSERFQRDCLRGFPGEGKLGRNWGPWDFCFSILVG
jgi:hypothetical protein